MRGRGNSKVDFFSCVSSSQVLPYSRIITFSFSLTFFVSKESYKETASLLKKDYCLLPSLNSFFKGDGYADESFCIVEIGNVMIAYAIINISCRSYPLSRKLPSAFRKRNTGARMYSEDVRRTRELLANERRRKRVSTKFDSQR